MCGIAGIISTNSSEISRQKLQLMTDAITHRGPEGEAFWINANSTIGFGHRRLCIIDLSSAGDQPMHYMDRYTIVYNGEIYNYIEIKAALEKKGYHFKSVCDTEVILAAYACYGNNCLDHFDGMFAFAIWDEQEQTMFCARDRFGEKPFYFYKNGDAFLFASEMKALWKAEAPRQVNNSMLLHYLALGYTSDPANPSATFYNDIYKLPAANCITIKLNPGATSIAFTQWQYWDLDKEFVTNDSEEAAIKKLGELLTTSVQRRLRSDVPIGSSLSGGLDSSSIVAIINKLIEDTAKQKTFSAVFPGFKKDESGYIKQVKEKFAIDNYTTTPTANGLATDLQTLMYHQEEPFQSASIYAQYKVYELAKQHGVTVVLDGQGADEILAGYNKYYHWYWQELIRQGKWKEGKSERDATTQNDVQFEWSWKNYLAAYMPGLAAQQLSKRANVKMNNAGIAKDFLHTYQNKTPLQKPVVDKLNDILYHDTMQNGLEDLLRYADRNSMAHSREVRLPFLNHELVQYIFSLPSSFKIKNGFTKYILRKTMEQMLPENIVWRKDKIGYEPPQHEWLKDKTLIELIMHGREQLVQQKILNPSILQLPVNALHAHDADNFDWRYLCATGCLF